MKRWSDWYQLPVSDYDSSPNQPLSYEDDEEVEAMRRETKAVDEQLRKIEWVLYDQDLILTGLHQTQQVLMVYAVEFLANLSNNGKIDINRRPPVEIAFSVHGRWQNFSTSGQEGDNLGVRDAWNGVVLWHSRF